MAYKTLYISFNTYKNNLLLIIYYQAYKFKIIELFKVSDKPNFNPGSTYFLKYYIQYIISIYIYCILIRDFYIIV